MEANCIFISFYCALQFKIIFFFNFADKINSLFCIYFGFFCFFSSLGFYPLVYGLSRKRAKHFIEDKQDVNIAYFSETVQKFIRNFLFGFIQGLFLEKYIVLLSTLSSLKFVVFVLIFFTRNIYESKILFFLSFLYFLFGYSYDAFLLYTHIFIS